MCLCRSPDRHPRSSELRWVEETHLSWGNKKEFCSFVPWRDEAEPRSLVRPMLLVSVWSQPSFLEVFPKVHSQGSNGVSGQDHDGAAHKLWRGSPLGHNPQGSPLEVSIRCLHCLSDGLHACVSRRRAPLTPGSVGEFRCQCSWWMLMVPFLLKLRTPVCLLHTCFFIYPALVAHVKSPEMAGCQSTSTTCWETDRKNKVSCPQVKLYRWCSVIERTEVSQSLYFRTKVSTKRRTKSWISVEKLSPTDPTTVNI